MAAAAKALQEAPIVNAVIDGDDIVYRDYIDMSVAVSSPSGLVVPVPPLSHTPSPPPSPCNTLFYWYKSTNTEASIREDR
jgi:hypothetical protein